MSNSGEEHPNYHVAFESSDGTTISVDATVTAALTAGSVFKDLATASEFFKAGATGFSPNGNKYEGLYLDTDHWEVKPLEVSQVSSSYFENEDIFPKGSVHFDNALLMTNVSHEWSSVADKPCCEVESL